MKKTLIILFTIFFIFSIYPQDNLRKEIIDVIYESVFEVVIEKLSDSNITYEKPIPYENLPFSERNDKYLSIGTAFAVSDSVFISAAHVLSLENESQFINFYIRDKNGNVYEIDEIIKYSNYKDYVVFTIKNKNIKRFLNINFYPQLNQKVYAIGNALGDGIIIRDGLLTSLTLEKEKGEWQWLRFSAAASPGNSGGPLLDSYGNIIGIITMKSPNENLNYALPIKEILKDKNFYGEYRNRFTYSLPNMNKKVTENFLFKTLLPKNYLIFKKELVKAFSDFCLSCLNKIKSENQATIFPNGNNSLDLLYSIINAGFPHIIAEGEDGKWDAYYPKEIKKNELNDKGYVQYGNMMGIDLVYLKKPESILLIDLIKNSKLYMDTLLKAIPFNRRFLSENIRITSLGKAFEEFEHIDNYKRKWIIRTWLLPYMDSKLISFSLVVPGGIVSLIKIDQTGIINSSHLIDLKFLTDFIYLSYTGTFKEWLEFFNNDIVEYIPEGFKNISFNYENGKSFTFKTKEFDMNYNANFLNFNDSSYLQVNMAYMKENENVIWDVGGIVVSEDNLNSSFFSLFKKFTPQEGLSEKFYSEWDKIISKKSPYDGKVQYYEGKSLAYVVYNKAKKESSPVYFSLLGMEGNISQSKINKKIKELQQGLKFKN